ncbi:MAG: hypothetical protein GVY18_07145 [Bacteroidetes bacterium]|jgi:hypothetical protein|nr:hypothetical protein [Bacteroidota bacterium]
MRTLLTFLLLGLLGIGTALGQDHRFLPVEHVAYEHIERLQRRGHLLTLNPTALPYRYGAVRAALADLDRETLSPTEARWAALLEAMLGAPLAAEGARIGADLEAGVRATDSERLNPLRPLGDTLHAYPYGDLELWAETGPVVVAIGSRHDLYYDRDPDSFDTALRILARSEDSYASVNGRWASLTLGRLGRHWSVPSEAATVVSDNPRSYDQLSLRLGGDRLSVSGLLGELDSITEDGRYTGRAEDFFEDQGSRRRFLAAHRWDWRPSPHLSFAILESALYSASNAGVSLKFLNPLHPLIAVVDNTPKNDENNGFVGGLVWAQRGRWTLHGQLLFDDLDVLNLGAEPTSFALTSSLTYAAATMDVGARLTMVASRTYNTGQPEGKYIYLLRGLATQYSDYVQASAFADLYLDRLALGLRLTPRVDVLLQGEQDLRGTFPPKNTDVGTILDGTIERTLRPALRLFWQRSPRWWVRADVGANLVDNVANVDGATDTRVSGLLAIGLRLSTRRAYDLSF